MTERIKILEHHKTIVEKNWRRVTDISEAKDCVKDFVYRECNAELADGTQMYPRMETEKFIDNFAKIIVAVSENNVEVLPDWKVRGRIFNSDIICNSCGNLISQEIIVKKITGETNCDLYNRLVILIPRLR